MNLGKLFFLRITTAFVFAIFYSSLAIYLMGLYGLQDKVIDLTSTFIAVYYILPVVAGYIGNRWLNFTIIFPFALIIEAIGCITLAAAHGMISIYTGLTLFLIGSCVITVSINIFISNQYPGKSLTKKKSYFFNSIAMNIGILAGFLLAGFFDINQHLWRIFLVGGLLSLVNAVVAFTLPRTKISNLRKPNIKIIKAIAVSLAVTIITWVVLATGLVSKQIIFYAIFIVSISLFFYLIKVDKEHRKNYYLYFSFLLISIVFWSVYFISPIILLPLIKGILSGNHLSQMIAPQWVVAIDPASVVIFTPLVIFLLSKVGHGNKQLNISSGIFVLAMAFISFGSWLVLSGLRALDVSIILYYLLGFIFVASVGELLIGPIGYSIVSDLCRDKYRGILMGLWISSLGMSSVITSVLGKRLIVHQNTVLKMIHLPILLTIFTIIIGLLFFIFRKKISKTISF